MPRALPKIEGCNNMEQSQSSPRRVGFLQAAVYSLLAALVLCGFCFLLAAFTANDSMPCGKAYTLESLHVWNTGSLPEPAAFLADSAKNMVTDVRYQRSPSPEVGKQRVSLLLQMEDGTTRVEESVLDFESAEITWEIGTEVSSEALFGETYADAELLDALPPRVYPGDYLVNVSIGGSVVPFILHAQDTTPPAVEFNDPLVFHVGSLVREKHFVKSWSDICDEVTFVLSSDVYTGEPGVYPISITATDSNGNGATFELEYTVIE